MGRKRKNIEKGEEKNVRANLSFTPAVKSWAIELAKEDGYGDNLSAFIADLVRRRRERRLELEASKRIASDLASRAAKREGERDQ